MKGVGRRVLEMKKRMKYITVNKIPPNGGVPSKRVGGLLEEYH